MNVDIKAIDALLPQTQCGECGFKGCMPYAEALAQGTIGIDRCPPGGRKTVEALGKLLAIDPTPYLDAAEEARRPPSYAVIEEASCIGCTKCIQACPVDAIVGASKFMHAIIKTQCTGCGLCVEPCPVDCISMEEQTEISYDPELARQHYQKRQVRLLKEQQAREQSYQLKRQLNAQSADKQQDKQAKNAYILQALARVNAKKS